MDRDKVVDNVLGAIFKKGQEEASALIGQPVEFSDSKVTKSTREDLFNGLQDQQVLAELKVEGDREGTAYLLCPLKDALTLGGALIMLPEEELQERIAKGEFGPDEADAFGEISNILAGVITGLFDEGFPDSLRFVKTEQHLLNPLNVVAKDEYPMPAGTLYLATGNGSLQGKPLSGPVQVIVPADILGLEASAESTSGEENPDSSQEKQPSTEEGTSAPAPSGETGTEETNTTDATAKAAEDSSSESDEDSGKGLKNDPNSSIDEQQLIKLLKVVHAKVRDEVGGFLGHAFEISNEKFIQVKREALFENLEGTQVLARMRVEGDRDGEACLVTNIGAAIRLGGTLIMLPDSELQERFESGEYGAEDSDAFGEIVNIVAGIYSAVFNDLYPGNLRFVKTEQETIDPLAIKTKDEYPVKEGDFFLAGGDASLNGVDLGHFSVFVPVDVLGLEKGVDRTEKKTETKEAGSASSESAGENDENAEKTDIPEDGSKPSGSSTSSSNTAPAGPESDGSSNHQSTILVCSDSEEQANVFLKAIEGLDCVARFQNVQDNVGGYGPETRGVFLVLGDVGEQGIAAAIKINASIQGRMPLIAAGPNWTKSMVLRAIKYGIKDILVTPASEAQIQAKVKLHLVA